MYEYITGKLDRLTPASAVVEAGGIGYHINISLQTYSQIEHAQEVKLLLHHIVREDAHLLYGFFSQQEREIFRMLIGVSGVGALTARMILSTYAPHELAQMIATENTPLLKNVKGLGLKTAQKICVDLRDKILAVTSLPEGGTMAAAPAAGVADMVSGEAVAALVMLGFSRGPSEKVVRALSGENPDAGTEEIVRMALKKL
jgi:Holliday junction DNA helicase RuvA